MISLFEYLAEKTYPGRGIVLGRSDDGNKAIIAYFIMGRSENSRNRIFVEDGAGIRTEAFDPVRLVDPRLIIYAPVKVLGNKTIVTNGDQTDTIYLLMDKQQTFEQALRTRTFEPDAPNYTPRISGILHLHPELPPDAAFNFALSILKSDDGDPTSTLRHCFAYNTPRAGIGRLIHTYRAEVDPLPSFQGEPVAVGGMADDIDVFTEQLWRSLNDDNKVSLFVRYIDLASGDCESRIVNKNQ